MNSQSEKKSFDSLVDALVEKNNQSMAEIELKPYTPTVYAIPGPMWESMMEMLKTACTFQPTLYRKLEPLATWAEVQELAGQMEETQEQAVKKALTAVAQTNRQALTEIREELEKEHIQRESFQKQVGSAQEEFTSKVSKDFSVWKKELEAFQQEDQRRWKGMALRFTLGLVLSWALAFGVLWMLLR